MRNARRPHPAIAAILLLLAACSKAPEASSPLAQWSAQRIDELACPQAQDAPGFRRSVANFRPRLPAALRHEECASLPGDTLQPEFFHHGLQEILPDTYTPREMEIMAIRGNILSPCKKEPPNKMKRIGQQQETLLETMRRENSEGLAAAKYTDSAVGHRIQQIMRGQLEHPEIGPLVQSETYRQKMTDIFFVSSLSPREIEDIWRDFELQLPPGWSAELAALEEKKDQMAKTFGTRVSGLLARAVAVEFKRQGEGK
jgi:hypothetical protein